MFELVDVVHRYGDVPAVAVPTGARAAGEAWLLSGPSGCGKSTLLHILAGLVVADAGTRASSPAPICGAVRRRARPLARPHVGLVPQRLHLVGALNVRDNLRLAQSLPGLPADDARIRALLRGGRRRRPRASLSARAVAGPGAARRHRARGRQPAGAAAGRRADRQPGRRARGAGAGAPARAGARSGRDAGRRVARRAREAAAAARVRAAARRWHARSARMSARSRLALAYARRRPLSTLLVVVLLAVGVATIALTLLLVARARDAAHARRRRHRPRRRRARAARCSSCSPASITSTCRPATFRSPRSRSCARTR